MQPSSNSGPPVLAAWVSVLGVQSTMILILLELNLAKHEILQSNLKSIQRLLGLSMALDYLHY